MKLPYWELNQKKDRELVNEHFNCLVTKSELDFVVFQAKEEITSKNHILRRALHMYMKSVGYTK